MAGELEQVLTSVLSTDNHIRAKAEARLVEWERENVADFLCRLGKVLVDESASPDGRQVAGNVLKNMLEKSTGEIYATERFGEIGTLVFQAFTSSFPPARSLAAQAAAKVALHEIENGLGRHVLGMLISGIGAEDVVESVHEASMDAAGFVCEELVARHGYCARILDQQLIDLVEGLVLRMSTSSLARVHRSACKALLFTLDFLETPLGQATPNEALVGLLLRLLDSQDVQVRAAAVQCFNKIGSIQHERLSSLARPIFEKTARCVLYDEEMPAMHALEFWSTVISRELNLLERVASFQDEYGAAVSVITPYGRRICGTLLRCLLMQQDFQDEEIWNKCASAREVLRQLAKLAPGTVVECVILFIDDNICDENSWRRRQAAVEAFGAVCCDPMSDTLEDLAEETLPLLLIALVHEDHDIVRESVARTLAELSTVSRKSCERMLADVETTICVALEDNAMVAKNACLALKNIAESSVHDESKQQMLAKGFRDSFITVATALSKLYARQDVQLTQAQVAAVTALGAYTRFAPAELVGVVQQVLMVLMEWLDSLRVVQPQSLSESRVLSQMKAVVLEGIEGSFERMGAQSSSCIARAFEQSLLVLQSEGDDAVQERVVDVMRSILRASSYSDLKTLGQVTTTIVRFLYQNRSLPMMVSKHCFEGGVRIVQDVFESRRVKPTDWIAADTVRFLMDSIRSLQVDWKCKPCLVVCLRSMIDTQGDFCSNFLAEILLTLKDAGQAVSRTEVPFDDVDGLQGILEMCLAELGACLSIVQKMEKAGQIETLSKHWEWMLGVCRFVGSYSCNNFGAIHLYVAALGSASALLTEMVRVGAPKVHPDMHKWSWVKDLMEPIANSRNSECSGPPSNASAPGGNGTA